MFDSLIWQRDGLDKCDRGRDGAKGIHSEGPLGVGGYRRQGKILTIDGYELLYSVAEDDAARSTGPRG